jgi:hypothetical protein
VPKSAKLIKQTSHCPDIALFIVRFLLTKLRRQIKRRSNNCLRKIIGHEHFGHTQISNFDILIFIKKNIQSFDVPVQDFVLMNVLKPQANLNKELPYFLLLERFFILHFEVHREIAIVTILHNNMQSIIFDKRLLILYDKRMNKFAHDRGFVQSLR